MPACIEGRMYSTRVARYAQRDAGVGHDSDPAGVAVIEARGGADETWRRRQKYGLRCVFLRLRGDFSKHVPRAGLVV